MAPSMKLIGLFATSVGVVVAITTMTAFWAVVSWANPLAPTVYLATALFGVFVVMGGIWFVVTRRELATGIGVDGASAEERGLQRLAGLAASVLIGVFALGIVAMWNLDTVRAEFVASRGSHVELEAVLADPSPIVRLRACEELFQRGWVFRSQQALVAALDPQPAVATKCLQTAKENDWKGFVALASDLNEGWMAAMMSAGPGEVQIVCEHAPWSPVMSDLSEERTDVRLLECALGAASDEVRQCCATTLASRGKLLDQMGPADKYPSEGTDKIFPPLVLQAFQPLTLTSGQQQVVATLGLDDEAVRRWAVELGCWSVDPERAQTRMIGAMYPLIEADSCGLTPAEESQYRSASAWTRLCDQVLSDDSGKPIQQVVCAGVQDARMLKTTDLARIEIRRAIRAPFLEKDADFLESGLLAAAIIGTEGEKQAELDARADRTGLSDSWGALPQGYRKDMTVGDLLRADKARKEQLRKDIANPMGSKGVVDAYKRAGKDKRAAMIRVNKEYGAAMQAVKDNK